MNMNTPLALRQRLSYLALCISGAISAPLATAQALEEVIVTAQFKEQNLQSVPIAITALSEEVLELRSMNDALAINESVPNINLAKNTGVASGMKVFLRGIGEDESRIGADPAVGIYVDDVYIGRQTGALIDLADVQQIEVLRGPQGTLYGRNANGGALRVTTKQPSLDDTVTLNVTGGSDDARNAYAMVNQALSEKLAGQVSVMTKNQRGYMVNTDNGEHLGDIDKAGGRVALKYFGDQWDILWSADYLRDKSEPGYGNRMVGDDGNIFTTSQAQYPTSAVLINGTTRLGELYNDLIQRGTMVKATSTLGDWDVTSITAYRELDHEMLTIITAAYYQDLQQNQVSQEVRFARSGENYDWLTGVYLYREHIEQYAEFFLGSTDIDQLTKSAALFTQYTYNATDKLALTGGLRYTWESKDWDAQTSANYWNSLGRASAGEQDDSWGHVSWKAVAAYDLSPTSMTYLSITTGFKSGGWSVDSFQPVKDESVITYEWGLKSDLTDALRVNANLFFNDYTDLQINGSTAIGFTRVNAGDVETYGLELAVTWQATEQLTLDAFLGTLEGEYKTIDDSAAGLITTDLKLKQAPELSYGVNATHRLPIAEGQLVTNLQYAYTDEQFNDLANSELIKRDETDIVNLRIGYQWGSGVQYSVALWGKNLLDEEYAAAGTAGDQAVYPGDPRTWGVDAKVTF